MQRQEDFHDFKKKREEFAINVRRAQREETISRRRNISSTIDQPKKTILKILDVNFETQITEFQKSKYNATQLNELLNAMQNGEIIEKHRGIIGIRKLLLAVPDEQFYVTLCKAGAIPLLFEFAKQNQYPQLNFEAFWSLANLCCSSTQICNYLIQMGIFELFAAGLKTKDEDIIENAIWGFGNLAADSIANRDRILEMGVLQRIVQYAGELKTKKKYQDACWALANLSRGAPTPSYELIKSVVPIFGHGFRDDMFFDDQMLSDVLWSCASLTEGQKTRLTRFQETGGCPAIFKYLQNSYAGVYIPTLRIIGNFSNGYQSHTDVLLENNFLDLAIILLEHPKQVVRKEVAWIISNIAAGSKRQVMTLLSKPALIHKLVLKLDSDRPDVQVQILWMFANLERAGVPKDVYMLYQVTAILQKASFLLGDLNQYVLINTLECIYKFLKLGEKMCSGSDDMDDENPMKRQTIEKGLLVKIVGLQSHESPKIYEVVNKILETYFQNTLSEEP